MLVFYNECLMAQEGRFAELLAAVAREVTLRQGSEVCCGDLTLEQFRTLQAVAGATDADPESAGGPPHHARIGSLSAALGVDLSTMSRNISVLERNGYLLRARSAQDGRIVLVRLTAKGRRALETLRCSERDVLKQIYDHLSPVERPRVLRALESLRLCLVRTGADKAEICCAPAAASQSLS